MNKNLLWKMGIIVLVIFFAFLWVWPPQDKLKAGIDIAGGTSMIWDIDTTGLEREESQGLAQRMIPILMRRIDPTNVANIVMRPQGNRRIEIQLPFASKDVIKKRKVFQDAFKVLQDQNINLIAVKKALFSDEQNRQEVFDAFAGDSADKIKILEDLAKTYDERKEKQQQRDELSAELEKVKSEIESAGLDGDAVGQKVAEWLQLSDTGRVEAISKYLETDTKRDETYFLATRHDVGLCTCSSRSSI